MVAHAAMKELGVPEVDVCPWALREGVLLCHAVWDARAFLPLHPISLAQQSEVCDIRQLVGGGTPA
jgi:exopolyphosphatase/guanosine-5'-triphosphate,3'-diphosphate pyrophosphatase